MHSWCMPDRQQQLRTLPASQHSIHVPAQIGSALTKHARPPPAPHKLQAQAVLAVLRPQEQRGQQQREGPAGGVVAGHAVLGINSPLGTSWASGVTSRLAQLTGAGATGTNPQQRIQQSQPPSNLYLFAHQGVT